MTSRTLRLAAPAAVLATLALTVTTLPADAAEGPDRQPAARAVQQLDVPLVFAHRGASGYRPEHTLAAYELAIRLGADYVEPDLVSTKDGVLVARHENEIGGTTDVADHPEFAARRTTKSIDGVQVTGWFTEDFTLRELKTLRAKERLPLVRPGNTRYDGRFPIPTLAEVLRLVRKWEKKLHTTIGVAPETKHPTYFDSIGLSLEEPLVDTLEQFGKDTRKSKVVIQSFEVSNLKDLDHLIDVPLSQLTEATGGPFDLRGQGTTYAQIVSADGLRKVRRYADWVGPEKSQVLPRDAAGATSRPTRLVRDAHRIGLRVVVYTVRDENQFLPTNFRRGTDPDAKGDVRGEIESLLDTGIDGFFADYTDSGVDARDAWLG
ncbi:glycerophosphodiester phosphodiesterase [Nocardioides sp.]|uniref:glycerophosphodiester phosphodiesterase n=1 Tax=Nocardioides sp. TaxID=35761 RepID=UPI0027263633|nr:glycerophosphodiester phosphodiesterase [Nocardioides sp.]MDO9457753.1 glycerophosphodiester phosphodiesterase [Nocardioides sp.]